MKLPSRPTKSSRSVLNLAVLALCGGLMFGIQVAMQALPNIELVSLLVILFTLKFGLKSLSSIYVFVLLEGLLFGFHIWFFSYLYVWTLLAFAVWLLRDMRTPLGWAVLSGIFGLLFGALCSLPYFYGGAALALSYWISGIPFDLIHCVSNFIICLVLWKPLHETLKKLPVG